MWDRLPSCQSPTATVSVPCAVPTRFDAVSVTRLIGKGDRVWWLRGDMLTIIARPKERWAMLCCAIQQPLEPIAGTEFAGATVRIPDIAHAIFDVDIAPGEMVNRPTVRGPLAPPAPPRVDKLAGTMTSIAFPSKQLGEKRQVTVYVPASSPPGKLLPVFYLADGGLTPSHRSLRQRLRMGLRDRRFSSASRTRKAKRPAALFFLPAIGGHSNICHLQTVIR